MIVVDTSVWIDHLNDIASSKVRILRATIRNNLRSMIARNLILCEILQGLAPDDQADAVEAALRHFGIASMVDSRIAGTAARHDRDFDHLERLRGLKILRFHDA